MKHSLIILSVIVSFSSGCATRLGTVGNGVSNGLSMSCMTGNPLACMLNAPFAVTDALVTASDIVRSSRQTPDYAEIRANNPEIGNTNRERAGVKPIHIELSDGNLLPDNSEIPTAILNSSAKQLEN
ncbi:MAG TPA: hypothetical protein VK448_00805 [Dissulfurispiraceae bacterium]|nr:hypothetical protein [Dissulfurispiraceae bacterium]